jgi:hypothetical protein
LYKDAVLAKIAPSPNALPTIEVRYGGRANQDKMGDTVGKDLDLAGDTPLPHARRTGHATGTQTNKYKEAAHSPHWYVTRIAGHSYDWRASLGHPAVKS